MLVPDPANVRKHGAKNLDAIKGSLARFGQQKPIVVSATGVVVAGNGTLAAAVSLGWTEIDVVRSPLVGSEATAYAIADNRTAELADWDDDALAQTLAALAIDDEALAIATGFDASEIDKLTQGEIDEDEVPEPPEIAITKAGDLWLLGEHRVLCGDSTSVEDVTRLMRGEKVSVAFTSPPYASQRKYDESSGFTPIKPNDFVCWYRNVAATIATILAHDGSYFCNIKEHCEDGQRVLYVKDLTLAHAREWGWLFVDEFAWVREGVPGKWGNRFKNKWEPIFHFCRNQKIKMRHEAVSQKSDRVFKSSKTHTLSRTGFIVPDQNMVRTGMALPGNVLMISAEHTQSKNHSAPFPVALPSFFILAFSDDGDNVYDPFLGSGSTLIAAEQLKRKCYGMEISPQYCDVIVKRWETLTGKTATLETP